MGLDLYHYKATMDLRPASGFCCHSLGEFDSDALDVFGFRRFVQIVDDFEFITGVYAFKSEDDLNFFLAGGERIGVGVQVVIGDPTGFPAKIEQIERDRGLNGKQRFISVSTHWTDRDGLRAGRSTGYTGPIQDFRWGSFGDLKTEMDRRPTLLPPFQYLWIFYCVSAPVISVEEVGYQRKGMSREFYREFMGNHMYVMISDVQRAYQLIDRSHGPENEREVRAHFRAQFLDEFEEGRSIFYASW